MSRLSRNLKEGLPLLIGWALGSIVVVFMEPSSIVILIVIVGLIVLIGYLHLVVKEIP